MAPVESQIAELRELIDMQIAGWRERDAVFARHTDMLQHQAGLLSEILDILTAEPEGESPLVTLIRQLTVLLRDQSATLARIEAAVSRGGSR